MEKLDPQLTDVYSYSYVTRGSILLRLIEFFSDIYMKKCFQLLQYFHKPKVYFFIVIFIIIIRLFFF